jgi:hypothetical protein
MSDDDDGFDMIADQDECTMDSHLTEAVLKNAPWLHPTHPLYFPDTQTDPAWRWEAVNGFNVESWYPAIQHHTFKTVFVPLNRSDVKLLVRLHRYVEEGTNRTVFHATGEEADQQRTVPSQLDEELEAELSPAEKVGLQSLLDRLRKGLAEVDGNGQGAFLRLSTRSPKDSAELMRTAPQRMCDDRYNWNETENHQQQVCAFVASMLDGLKVRSAESSVDIIVGSPRVFADFLGLLAAPNEGDAGKVVDESAALTQVILREWMPIRLDYEFRVFVVRAEGGGGFSVNQPASAQSSSPRLPWVTGISQYFHFLCFESPGSNSADRRRTISTATQPELDELRDHIKYFVCKIVDPLLLAGCEKQHNQYIIDLALRVVKDDVEDIQVRPPVPEESMAHEPYLFECQGQRVQLLVVELNAFAPAATGAGCFSWKDDLKILWPRSDEATEPITADRGVREPSMRVRQVPRPSFDGVTLLPVGYEEVIQQALMLRRQQGN